MAMSGGFDVSGVATPVTCLVAICSHLSLGFGQERDFDTWCERLAEILPRCERCPPSVERVRDAAFCLLQAETGRPRQHAMTRLRLEAAAYFGAVARERYAQIAGAGNV